MKYTQPALKVTAATALIFGVSLLGPMGAFAQVSDSSIVNSGDGTNVSTVNEQMLNLSVTNTNNLTSNQSLTATADSGHNTLDGNIGGSTLTTGAATVQGMFTTTGNSSLTSIGSGTGTSDMSGQGLDVVNTGDDADISTLWSNVRTATVNNYNTANVSQTMSSTSNSGYNNLDGNIGSTGTGASLTTGATGVGANFQASGNQSVTALNFGSTSGTGTNMGSMATITNTGDGATVDSTTQSTTTVGVNNMNTATVNQSLFGTSNSGYNSFSGGIGGSSLMTGPASFMGSFGTNTNASTTGIGQLGSFSGLYNLGDIVNTGDGLTTTSTSTNTTSIGVTNSNNLFETAVANVSNNSGNNEFDGNIGGTGTSSTGAATGTHQMNATGNSSSTVFGNALDVLAFLLLGS